MSTRAKVTRLALYLALAIWTSALYFPSLSNLFAYDDEPQIVRNPALRTFGATAAYFHQPVDFSEEFGSDFGSFYRPLFWLSLFADRAAWDLNPVGFHATNVVLHLMNGILVFLLFRQLLGQSLAFISALLWLSLPIHTEVVAWISGRGLSLSTLFVLLAVSGTANYMEGSGIFAGLLVAFSTLAALLSHEAGIVVLPLVLLTAAYQSRHERSKGAILVTFACTAVPLGLYLLFRTLWFGPPVENLGTLSDILLWAPVTFAKYLWWSIYPLTMSVERSTELAGVSPTSWIYIFAWLTLGCMGALLVRFGRVVPTLALGILWILLALVPFLHILPLYQSVAERYVYMASIGTVLVISTLLHAVRTRFQLPAWTPILAMTLWLALSVAPLRARIHNWSGARLLYATSLETNPGSHLLNYNLGVEYEHDGESEAAISSYERAIELKPDYVTARLSLANLHIRDNRFPEARQAYRGVLEYSPNHYEAQLNLAAVLLVQGESESGVDILRSLVDNNPNRFEARMNLGAVLLEYGEPAEARVHLETALRMRPESSEAAYNLGLLERDLGRREQARDLFRRALQYRADNRRAEEALQTVE